MCINCLICRDPPFGGIQSLVLKGLCSSVSEPHAFSLLSHLLNQNIPGNDGIVQICLVGEGINDLSERRLIGWIGGLLPWMNHLLHTSPSKDDRHTFITASKLSISLIHSYPKLSSSLQRFAEVSFY
jgi:hypothetical protein